MKIMMAGNAMNGILFREWMTLNWRKLQKSWVSPTLAKNQNVVLTGANIAGDTNINIAIICITKKWGNYLPINGTFSTEKDLENLLRQQYEGKKIKGKITEKKKPVNDIAWTMFDVTLI